MYYSKPWKHFVASLFYVMTAATIDETQFVLNGLKPEHCNSKLKIMIKIMKLIIIPH